MTTIPKITIHASARGWLATCRCGWTFWQHRRPVVDAEAVTHQAKCRHPKETR